MAESPADRRERIAEALYVMMVGHCATGDMHWSADLWAEQARVWADTFVAGAPEQPQPPADASPSLLEAAKAVVATWRSPVTVESMDAACAALRDAIAFEEARRG